MASEMQANGLDRGLGQSTLVRDAGGVEGESEGSGPECVKFGVLMRLALWHHDGCVARCDAVGHG